MPVTLYPRFATQSIRTALSDTPIVVIQGARQVGKSTLAQQLADEENALMLTLDEDNTLRFAESDPIAFVDSNPDGMLIVDEAQRSPGLILPLKANVDRRRLPGRFLLTGSADLLKVKGVADSLAGRAETVEMFPLSQGEIAHRDSPEDFIKWLLAGASKTSFEKLDPHAVILGGYPEANQRGELRARSWFESYVARLSDHDAAELSQGGFADQLTSLLALIASQGQSELVKAKLARSLGIAESSVDVYLRLATTMRLIVRYPSWNRNPRGRVVRRPKISLLDTGLSAALTEFTVPMSQHPGGREYYGTLVEQFVALELSKQQTWASTPFKLYHFRESDGLEVDLIAETYDGDLIAIEVKSTRTITEKHWNSLVAFRERFPERNITGVVLHTGDFTATMWGWLHILPITSLWQH